MIEIGHIYIHDCKWLGVWFNIPISKFIGEYDAVVYKCITKNPKDTNSTIKLANLYENCLDNNKNINAQKFL